MKLLEKKTALISGGSRGIGKAIVEAFAMEGAQIVFSFLKSKEKARNLEKNLKKITKIKAYKADLRRPQSAKILVKKAIDEFGKIDILVNNAGLIRDSIFIRMRKEDWNEVIQTNLSSIFYLTQEVVKKMIKKGSIINISSLFGVLGNKGQVNYSTSKSGIIGFSKSVSKELGSRNIRCNVVSPGFINTEMLASMDEEMLKEWINNIPLKRFGYPKEIAQACIFLASDMSSYISGEVLNVNGGMSLI
ncbi:MAG TPA: 3-oxoacyl-[acyl-carrier-protein] reductase [Candidatus Angelobacter sp.]|jgi:3-oxoacyl-[acyl-carrier protein] reductase|nr:3-oxoacyl-[acyl-carrier-protein] reductase [Candidatus Angelobacter sp.]